MTTVTKPTASRAPSEFVDPKDDKRRRRNEDTKTGSESPKMIMLPQKKRVLPAASSSGTSSPAKKSQKLSNSQDESAADETLIRETEAALKSLSGSWMGHRGPTYKEQSPTFENLFAENKPAVKMSPTSSTTSSNDTSSCSLKDVITLRDQHEELDKGGDRKGKPLKIKQENIGDSSRSDDECGSQFKIKGKVCVKTEQAQYESHDFNELVDDSSNELEIDMSETSVERNEMMCDEKSDSKKHEVDVKCAR